MTLKVHVVNYVSHSVGEVHTQHDDSAKSVELTGDDAIFGCDGNVGGGMWKLDDEESC